MRRRVHQHAMGYAKKLSLEVRAVSEPMMDKLSCANWQRVPEICTGYERLLCAKCPQICTGYELTLYAGPCL